MSVLKRTWRLANNWLKLSKVNSIRLKKNCRACKSRVQVCTLKTFQGWLLYTYMQFIKWLIVIRYFCDYCNAFADALSNFCFKLADAKFLKILGNMNCKCLFSLLNFEFWIFVRDATTWRWQREGATGCGTADDELQDVYFVS